MRHTFVFVAGVATTVALSYSSTAIAVPSSGSSLEIPTYALPELTLDSVSTLPDYLLGPGDQIEVRVYGYEEYTGPLTILPDGSISLPVIGRLTATGQTLDQLTQTIKYRLDPLLVNPSVEIQLLRLRPMVVTVSGEVQRPGPVQLQGLTPTPETSNLNNNSVRKPVPTLSVAIAEAGGVTPNADLKSVTLKRLTVSGQYETQTVNLWDMVQANTPSDLLLRDGDIISVPKTERISVGDQRLLARSSFAPETVKVRVVGEVKLPGEVEVSPDSTLSSAIANAGGPTDDANLKKVAFVRITDDGQFDPQEINLETLSDTVQVQDGDVLVVPKLTRAKAADVGRSILSPLSSLGNLLFLLFR